MKHFVIFCTLVFFGGCQNLQAQAVKGFKGFGLETKYASVYVLPGINIISAEGMWRNTDASNPLAGRIVSDIQCEKQQRRCIEAWGGFYFKDHPTVDFTIYNIVAWTHTSVIAESSNWPFGSSTRIAIPLQGGFVTKTYTFSQAAIPEKTRKSLNKKDPVLSRQDTVEIYILVDTVNELIRRMEEQP